MTGTGYRRHARGEQCAWTRPPYAARPTCAPTRGASARVASAAARRRPSWRRAGSTSRRWARGCSAAQWAAVALDVGSRLWLATAVARRRDGLLVHLLLPRTLAALAGRAILLAVDGFARDVSGARSLVRVPERMGRAGRPRLVWPEGFALAQVVKAGLERGEGIVRRVVVGTEATVAAALAASHGGTTINTAYSERLNATLRERLAPLVRRWRTPAHSSALVEGGLHLLRLAYNYCWVHESLRLRAIGTGHQWVERTPAMAAGLAGGCRPIRSPSAPPPHPDAGDRPHAGASFRFRRPPRRLEKLRREHACVWLYRCCVAPLKPFNSASNPAIVQICSVDSGTPGRGLLIRGVVAPARNLSRLHCIRVMEWGADIGRRGRLWLMGVRAVSFASVPPHPPHTPTFDHAVGSDLSARKTPTATPERFGTGRCSGYLIR